MLTAFGVLAVFCLILLAAAARRERSLPCRGVAAGLKMFLRLLPVLVLAFLLAGLIKVVIPPELIESWLGEEAGWRGAAIGSVCGALLLGGPFVSFPVFAAVFQAGAGIGTAVSLVTGWALCGVGQLLFESALIGPRFMALRLSIVIPLPFLAGLLAHLLLGG
jgi:uncharacterized membrane protein YraQ (UPF0718 family)